MAVSQNNINIVRELISNGADINEKNVDNNTPLHLATNENDIDIVRELISKGADINGKNLDNNTPLYLALERNNLNICYELIKYGLDKEIYEVNDQELYVSRTEWFTDDPLGQDGEYRCNKINDLVINNLSNRSLYSKVFHFFHDKKMLLEKTNDLVNLNKILLISEYANGEKYNSIDSSETDTSSSESESEIDTNNEILSSNKKRVRRSTESDTLNNKRLDSKDSPEKTAQVVQAMASGNRASNPIEEIETTSSLQAPTITPILRGSPLATASGTVNE